MATLSVQNIVRSGNGLDPTYAAAANGGDEFVNDGKRTFVHILNANAATRTVTFATPKTVAGLAVADLAVVVPVTPGEAMVGPFPADTFNDGDGKVQMTYSTEVDLTIAVIQI